MGYGKRFAKSKTFELWGDVGGGNEWEKYYGQDTSSAGFVLLSIDWDWQITEALRYEQIFRWQQYFEDNGRYKIYIEARFSLPVSKHWTFMMVLRDEFNSDPNPPNVDNDVTMILTLNFNFAGELQGKPDPAK